MPRTLCSPPPNPDLMLGTALVDCVIELKAIHAGVDVVVSCDYLICSDLTHRLHGLGARPVAIGA